MAFLRLDRQGGDGARIEPPERDGLARLFAIAVGAILDPVQCSIDLGDQFPLPVARPKFEGPVRLGRGAVDEVGEDVVLILQVLERFPALAQNVLLPGEQLVAEIFPLPLVHEGLVFARPVFVVVVHSHESSSTPSKQMGRLI